MQIISTLTREEVEGKPDPLDLACHAINRLKLMGTTIMEGSADTNTEPLDGYSGEDIYTMGEIVMFSTEEVETLIGISQRKNRALIFENRELKARIGELIGA